jgi:hypothetical protein
LLVDAWNRRIHRYSAGGKFLGYLDPPSTLRKEDWKPSAIEATTDGYLIEYDTGKLLRTDRRWREMSRVDVFATAKSSTGQVVSIFQWTPLEEGILAFGDVKTPGGGYSALLQIPLGKPQGFRVVERVELDETARQMFLLQMIYLASPRSPQTAYFYLPRLPDPDQAAGSDRLVGLGQVAGLAAPAAQELTPAFEGLSEARSLPEVHLNEDPLNARVIFERLERTSFVSGVASSGSSVFLLLREARGVSQKSLWRLRRVDLGGQALTRSDITDIPLGIQAHHLSMVAGPDRIAFVVKGPVEGFGKQQIEGLIIRNTREL